MYNKHNLHTILILLLLMGCGTSITQTKILQVDENTKPNRLEIHLEGSLQNPAYISKDTIVFTQFMDGYNEGESNLYIYNLGSKKLTKLISDTHSNVNLIGNIYSKKNNAIVYSSTKGNHDEIYMIDIDTKKIKPLTSRQNLQAFEPSIAADADFTVFESHGLEDDSKGIITKFSFITQEYSELTSLDDDTRQANVSSDLKYIVYQKLSKEGWSVWMMNIDGRNKQKITGEYEATDACFSADNSKIIFSAEMDDEAMSNIYSIDIVSKKLLQLTDDKYYEGAPSIREDSKEIIFESSHLFEEEIESTQLYSLTL